MKASEPDLMQLKELIRSTLLFGLESVFGSSGGKYALAGLEAVIGTKKPDGMDAAVAKLTGLWEAEDPEVLKREGRQPEVIFAQVKSILGDAQQVRKALVKHQLEPKLAAQDLSIKLDPLLESSLREASSQVIETALTLVLEDPDYFKTLQPLLWRELLGNRTNLLQEETKNRTSDLIPSTGSKESLGHVTIGLYEREITDLRGELTDYEKSELEDLRLSMVEGRRNEAFDRIKGLQAKPTYRRKPEVYRSEIHQLAFLLWLDLDLEQAEKQLQLAVELNQGRELVRLSALLELRRGSPAAAMQLLANATSDGEIHLKAEILMVQGHPQRALELLAAVQAPSYDTHRLLALGYLHTRNCEEALAQVCSARQLEPKSSAVAFAEARILFYTAVSPTVIPPCLVMSPPPFPLHLARGTDASRESLGKALELFKGLVGFGESETRDLRSWIVAVHLLLEKRQEAQALITSALEHNPTDLHLIEWCLAGSLECDLSESTKLLEENIGTAGQFNPDKVVALANVYNSTKRWDQTASLLERFKSDFVQADLESTWITWRCQAFVLQGEALQALELVPGDTEKPELTYLRSVLLALASSKKQIDSQEAVDYCLLQYSNTTDPIYLLEASRVQMEQGNWNWLAEHAAELVARVGTMDALQMGLEAARRQGNAKLCLQLLEVDSWPEEAGWMYEARVFAHKELGNLEVARDWARKYWEQSPTRRSFLGLAQIYRSLGELDSLAGLSGQLDTLSPPADAGLLLWLSESLSSHFADLARRLWKKAVKQDLEDALVPPAFFLASQLGLSSDPATIKLVSRFQAEGKESQFGLRRVDLNEMKALAEGRQEGARVAQKDYMHGAPVHFLVPFGVSLVRIYHQLLDTNSRQPDPDKQSPLLFRSGLRETLPSLPSNCRIHIDLTALLLAAHFNVLEDAIERFRPLRIAPSLIPTLHKMGAELKASQPDLAAANRLVYRSLGGRILIVDDDQSHPEAWWLNFPSELENHPGQGLTAATLLACLEQAGKLTATQHETATRSLGNCLGEKQEPLPSLRDNVRVHWVWARLLAQALVLEVVCDCFRLEISTKDAETVRAQHDSDEQDQELNQWLEVLTERVQSGLTSGDFQRIAVATEKDQAPELASLLELLRFNAQPGDCIWGDDRFLSMHRERSEGVLFIGLLDVLQQLRLGHQISDEQFWNLRLELRKANLRYLPVESDEISYWLNKNKNAAELQILRRSCAATFRKGDLLAAPTQQDGVREWSFLAHSAKSVISALIDCFDTARAPAVSYRQADWILQNLYVELSCLRELAGALHDDQDIHRQAVNLTAIYWEGFLRFRKLDDTESALRESLFRWLNFRMLRLKKADLAFWEQMALEMRSFFRVFVEQSGNDPRVGKALAQRMIFELEDTLRDKILEDESFNQFLGVKFLTKVTLQALNFQADDFQTAIVECLTAGSARLTTVDGQAADVEIVDPNFPTFRLLCAGEEALAQDPTLGLLSPDEEYVQNLLQRHPEWTDGPKSDQHQNSLSILSAKSPDERLRLARSLVAASPACRYATLHHQVATTRQNDKELFQPAPTERLLRKYGLTLPLTIPFELALKPECSKLTLLEQIERVSAFPISLPPWLMSDFRALPPDEQAELCLKLSQQVFSPLAKIHLLRLMAEVADNLRDNEMQSILSELFSPDARIQSEVFLQVVRRSVRTLQDRGGDPLANLALGWSHAHHLFQALLAARAHIEDIARIYSDLEEADPPPQFEEPNVALYELSSPFELREPRFLAMATVYILSTAKIELTTLVERLEGDLRDPSRAVDLLAGAAGGDKLGSWLSPPPKDELKALLGDELGGILCEDELTSGIANAVVELCMSPYNLPTWFQLLTVFRGRKLFPSLFKHLDAIVTEFDSQLYVADLDEDNWHVFFLIVGEVLVYGGSEIKEAFFQFMLKVLTATEAERLEEGLKAHVIYQVCLRLSQSEGPAGATGFCRRLEEAAERRPVLAPYWLEGICSLAWELPIQHARAAWRCLLYLRAV
ncbi:MAG: hypothetical protein U0931_40685 [Vulcanimicrobiota bacterium]